jgi:hypothetical protein
MEINIPYNGSKGVHMEINIPYNGSKGVANCIMNSCVLVAMSTT